MSATRPAARAVLAVVAVAAVVLVGGCAAATPLCDAATAQQTAGRLGAAAELYAGAQARDEGSCADDGLEATGRAYVDAYGTATAAAREEVSGNTAAAITGYESALRIDAGNPSALAGLARLGRVPVRVETPVLVPAAPDRAAGTVPSWALVAGSTAFALLLTGWALTALLLRRGQRHLSERLDELAVTSAERSAGDRQALDADVQEVTAAAREAQSTAVDAAATARDADGAASGAHREAVRATETAERASEEAGCAARDAREARHAVERSAARAGTAQARALALLNERSTTDAPADGDGVDGVDGLTEPFTTYCGDLDGSTVRTPPASVLRADTVPSRSATLVTVRCRGVEVGSGECQIHLREYRLESRDLELADLVARDDVAPALLALTVAPDDADVLDLVEQVLEHEVDRRGEVRVDAVEPSTLPLSQAECRFWRSLDHVVLLRWAQESLRPDGAVQQDVSVIVFSPSPVAAETVLAEPDVVAALLEVAHEHGGTDAVEALGEVLRAPLERALVAS